MNIPHHKILLFFVVSSVWSSLPGQALVAPSDLRAWPLSESSIRLEWIDEADNEETFEVFRREGFSGEWVLMADALAADSTAYMDQGLLAATTYQYQVVSRNQAGTSGSGVAIATTDDRANGIRTLHFQNGVNGYNGTVDLGIRETDPDTVFTNTYVWVDNNGSDGDNQALLRFDGIFGEAPDRLPFGASVVEASLMLYLGTNSNAQSYKTVSFHQMLVPWDINSSWGSVTLGENGVQIDNVEARAQYDAIRTFGMPDYTYDVDVTRSVQTWLDEVPPLGWLIRTGWSDGYAYYTSHNPVVEQRPMLVVQFDTNPDNNAPLAGPVRSPSDGATGVHEPATLEMELSDPDGDPLQATLYGRKRPSNPEEDFSVILLPDTQFYSGEVNGGTAEIFNSQTDWIIENRDALNIAFVLHMGDIVQSGDYKGSRFNGTEWFNASEALYRLHDPIRTGLEEGIPYAVNVGNHDQEPIWRSSGTTLFFNRYFGTEHFSQYSYYGGNYGFNNDNHYYLFRSGGYDFIVISLEYSDPARDPLDIELLEWADDLLKAYPNHRGIIVSHHMVNPGYPAIWSPYGEAIYEVLKDNPNLHLMLGGHVTGEGLRINTYDENTVYALVQDYQAYPEGGSGYLRMMTFRPDQNEIYLQTYSPWLDEFLDEFGGSLSLPYDMGTEIEPFVELDRQVSLAENGLQPFAWDNLDPDTQYEWFVTLDDGSKRTFSSTATFQTAARTYSSWKDGYFSQDDPEGDPGEDPDADGYANSLEFVFKGNPKSDEPLLMPVPLMSVEGNEVRFAYDRLDLARLVWEYQVSLDLVSWADVASTGLVVTETAEKLGNGFESVSLVVQKPSDEPLYLRVVSRLAD